MFGFWILSQRKKPSQHIRLSHWERLSWRACEKTRIGLISTTDGAAQLSCKLIMPPNFDEAKICRHYSRLWWPTRSNGEPRMAGWEVFVPAISGIAGFVVWCSNRGSANRVWRLRRHQQLGRLSQDQAAGTCFWGRRFIDKSRIGVFGWKYGGYMTLHCMMRRPDLFKVGVAELGERLGLYDSCYTERYIAQLSTVRGIFNPQFSYVNQLEGKLLVVQYGWRQCAIYSFDEAFFRTTRAEEIVWYMVYLAKNMQCLAEPQKNITQNDCIFYEKFVMILE